MPSKRQDKFKNERGSALVTALMVSLILMVACVGILLDTSMNTANVTDAVAEQQAYVAAEDGIQTALDVLRGNTVPSPLLDTSKAATDPANTINFIKAMKTSSSNISTDTSAEARLSRWINYNYTPSGASNPDRVVVSSGTYTPKTGMAFKLSLSDPDYTGDSVTYRTAGSIDGGTATKTFGTSPNTVTFTYNPRVTTTLNVSSGSVNSDIGTFSITTSGAGATIAQDTKFAITYTMTDPYDGVRVMRGYIKAGTITPASVGTVQLLFDSPTYQVSGSTLNMTGGAVSSSPSGYLLTPSSPNSTLSVGVAMTPVEPLRVLIRATGYGPLGSQKQLEAIVQKNFLNGMSAPATLTLVGSSTGFVFEPGQSQNVTYSGDDIVSSVIIPPVGTTNDVNESTVETQFATTGRKADVDGTPSNISVELPPWLQSPTNLDTTIQSLRNVAKSSGRYYANGDSPPNIGDNANAKGITFVEGDFSLTGSGGGILICTGKLTLRGGFDFNGLIIVTGAGGVDRRGGGNGLLQGNVVIAPYDSSNPASGFLPPKYDITGGGTSTIRYNSSSFANGLLAVSNFVLGVAEK